CQKLHVCRSYVLGNCKFGPRCKFSHDFRDAHNRDLCYENKVEGLPFDNIQKLLLPNDPALLPQMCNTYKVSGGNECEFNEKCTRLHLCKQFVLGNCKFGDNCRRNHNLNDRKIQILLNKFMLTAYRNDEVLKLLWKKEQIHIATRSSSTYVNTKLDKHRSDGDTAMENDKEEEICLYHLLSECQFKERCLKSHAKLPYRWQKRDKLTRIWEDIPDMETIEQRYCDPTNVRNSWNSVDFVRMTMNNNAVRRLSTANAVTKPDNFLLTTKWIWYWQEDVGKWITYGSQVEATTNEKAKSEVSSGDLEKAYEKDKKEGLSVFAGPFLYHVSFKEMNQTNMTLGTRRDVRRRPLFVSRRDVEAAR
uniref:Poly (ADP-ribose) polymerase family, member 12a n=1 Tax=Petromyzon marinus TaxID=7757 RepID=S4R5Q9_PETMA